MKKKIKIILIVLSALFAFALVYLGAVNAYVKSKGSERIITAEEAQELEDIDCIIVLGCLVRPDGTVSGMLNDRLTVGIELWKSGVSPKLLMSGDHGTKEYDEVNAMRSFAIEAEVPAEDIFMDHAGFCTYDSIYRMSEIFGAKKAVIVTQEYHLSRALYIAERLGIEAYGVPSDLNSYRMQTSRDIREVLARNKDFLASLFKVKPKYLGEKIDLTGDGRVTEG